MPTPDLLRLPDVMQRTGLARQTIHKLMRRGEFPRQIPLTDSGTAVGWRSDQIDAFVEERIRKAEENRARLSKRAAPGNAASVKRAAEKRAALAAKSARKKQSAPSKPAPPPRTPSKRAPARAI